MKVGSLGGKVIHGPLAGTLSRLARPAVHPTDAMCDRASSVSPYGL